MISFFKYWRVYFVISTLVIASGLYSIFNWGFNISIDFTGGTVLSYGLNGDKQIRVDQVELILEEIGLIDAKVILDKNRILTIKSSPVDDKKEGEIRRKIAKYATSAVDVLKYESVGPTIGAETVTKTIYAVLLAILGILIYVAYAFRNINYAIAAVIALFHDVLVVAGVYSIISIFFHAELDLLFVTAILTTLAFSVHDTIVVFDQMREYRKNPKFSTDSVEEKADRAVTSTIVRSLNNSLTIVFMLTALVLLGGESIRYFALALLVGTITGTYSSPFVSVPIAVFLEKRKLRLRHLTNK